MKRNVKKERDEEMPQFVRHSSGSALVAPCAAMELRIKDAQ